MCATQDLVLIKLRLVNDGISSGSSLYPILEECRSGIVSRYQWDTWQSRKSILQLYDMLYIACPDCWALWLGAWSPVFETIEPESSKIDFSSNRKDESGCETVDTAAGLNKSIRFRYKWLYFVDTALSARLWKWTQRWYAYVCTVVHTLPTARLSDCFSVGALRRSRSHELATSFGLISTAAT